MFLEPRKPAFNYFYHPIWLIQVPQGTLPHILNLWILQLPDDEGLHRTVQILSHGEWCYHYNNVAAHITHINHQFLQHCADKNIALNIEKCKFFQIQVTFAGFQLSAEGYQIDQSIFEAIAKYPTPINRSGLQSVIGLVNQLSTSTSNVATLLTQLKLLLSTKSDFAYVAKQSWRSILHC